jgi:hypothetical protein
MFSSKCARTTHPLILFKEFINGWLVACKGTFFLRSINDFFDEYFEQNIFCPPLSLPPNTFMIFAVCFVGSFSFNRQNCVEEVGRASLKN